MVNKVILVGRLCADPESKFTPSGVQVANFRIAVDRPFTKAGGEKETDFIDIVAWRQAAEFVTTYLGKGRLVLVDGRLQVRKWQTQDGQKRQSVEVVADTVKALDRKPADGEEHTAPRAARHAEPEAEPNYEVPDITDPFADQ